MNVLYLGVSPFVLTPILQKSGCHVIEYHQKIDIELLRKERIHFIVSYRYPFIIREPVIDFVCGKIVNLHISLLPFNRGADPNLWSFLENSLKGVTLHYIDCGVDTGDIIAQRAIEFSEENETLATTYKRLSDEGIHLFEEQWSLLMAGKAGRVSQYGMKGSTHRAKDKECFSSLLKENGWNTKVSKLIGRAYLQRDFVSD